MIAKIERDFARADLSAVNGLLQALTGYKPQTDFRDGVRRFVDWYRGYYGK